MGVGQSRVRPKIPESDDISFKSSEEKPSHKKKPGLVRFIIDAILGEVSPSPEELRFARFSESPESGADFEIEEAFVDAPLPAARHGKETKSERKVTPGRARAKRMNVTSKYSTNHSDDSELSSSSCLQGEVQTINSIQDERDVARLDPTPASKVSNEGIEMHVPPSHGRGDSATSGPKDSKVGNKFPNQDLEAPKTLDSPCSLQKDYHDYKGEHIPLADTQGTTALSTIHKILKLSAVGSDKLNYEKGGGEAKLNAGKDPNTLAVQEKGGLTGANTKSERPSLSTPETMNTASTALPPTDSQKPFPILKEAQGITRRHPNNKTKSELNKKRVNMFTVENRATLTKEDSEAPDSIRFQSNKSIHRTTALSTIQKMIELPAVGSDKTTNVKGRGESKLEAGKDSSTLAVKDETTRGLTASDTMSSNIKSNRPLVSNGEFQDASTASPSTNNKKHLTIFKRAQGIPRRNPRNLTKLLLEKKRVDIFTVEKTKDPTSLGEASYMRTGDSKRPSGKGKALQKRATRMFAPSLPPFTATAHQALIYPNRVMMKTATAESKVDTLDVLKRPGQSVTNSKPVTPKVTQIGTSLCHPDSKVDNVGRKEIQEMVQKTEVPKVQMVFQKEIPSVAELEEKVEEAKKELDKVEKYIRSKLDKRTKVTNVANNQVQVETVKQTPLILATLKAKTGDKSEGEVKKKPLLCPVVDKAVPRSVVFNGKKVGTATTADRKPVQRTESKDVLKSPPIDGEKRTDGALCKRQGPMFTRLRTRKVSRRKLSASFVNTPSGSDKSQEPLLTKTSKDPVPSCDANAITVANRSTPKSETEQAKRCSRTATCSTLSKVQSRSDVSHTEVDKETTDDSNPPLPQQVKELTCKGSDAKHKRTVTPKNALFAEHSMKLFDIKKQRLGLSKYSKHPLVPNVLSTAFTDITMQSLANMWTKSIACDFSNKSMNLLADFPPHFQQSPRRYFSIASTSNIRGGNETWISDRELESMFQESSTCWERQRPAILFNSNFYPRRPFLPDFDIIGCNISWTGESYHVQGVQYLPVFVRIQETDCGTEGVSMKGVETNSEEHAEEKPEENDEVSKLVKNAHVQPNHVPDQRSDVAETVQTESCKTTCQPTNHNSENSNVQVSHISDQSSDVVNTLQTNSPKPTNQVTRLESVRQLREDGSNNKIATEVKVESASKGMKAMEKDIDLQENHASNVDTKIKVPNEASGSVSKSIGETGKHEPSRKKDIKAKTKSQTVSDDSDSRAEAAGRYTKRKLGRGPRIVGDMRRIVHCQRNRHTDTPTTQLKIRFCLGCGDTKQPNGEPLIRCATCDQAFFCCTKCQRETRNEHRETCKGVKRNYCRHW